MGAHDLTIRTRGAFGDSFIDEILSKYWFCVIGCGALGSVFAEMLVRSGVRRLIIADGDLICQTNLNRTFAFTLADVGQCKATILKSRLLSINQELELKIFEHHVREHELERGNSVYDEMISADVVSVFIDNNSCRRAILKKLFENGVEDFLSAGMRIKQDGCWEYECAWAQLLPDENRDYDGLGYDQGSYSSSAMEVASVAFQLLLSNIHPKGKKRVYIRRTFEGFDPIPTEQFENSS